MMRTISRLKIVAQTLLPLIATILTLAPLSGRFHGGSGVVVLGVAICLTSGRRDQRRGDEPHNLRHYLVRVVVLPLTAVGVAAVAAVFATSLVAGDALFVAVVFLATSARAVGPRAAAVGRAAMLPLIALFIAPVRLDTSGPGGPARALLWAIIATTVAGLWMLGFTALLRPRRADSAAGGIVGPETSSETKVHLWRGTRSALSLALAFILGQSLFPDHWAWTVIAAFTIGVSARTRGDVLLKSAQRLGGALLGTVAATLLTAGVHDRPTVSVVLIITFLGVGLFLRQWNYLWWAFSITSVLSLLYGLSGQTGGAGLLRERLLAGLLGAACAILPGVFLAPVRTHALVLKRTGAALRAVGAALEAREQPQALPMAVRQAEHDIEELRDVAKPLLAIRRVHHRPELDWVDALTGALPDLKALPDGAAAARLGRVARQVQAPLREAVTVYRAAKA
jgi:hypothetical protein